MVLPVLNVVTGGYLWAGVIKGWQVLTKVMELGRLSSTETKYSFYSFHIGSKLNRVGLEYFITNAKTKPGSDPHCQHNNPCTVVLTKLH